MAVQSSSHQKLVDGYCIWDTTVSVPCANRHSCTDVLTMEISFVEGFFPPSEYAGKTQLNSMHRHKGESPCRVVMLVLMQLVLQGRLSDWIILFVGQP